MLRLQLRSWVLWAAIVIVAIEATLLLRNGSATFERPERWKAFILLLPFVVILTSIGREIWRSAERGSTRERIFRKALAWLYACSLAFVLAAIACFIFSSAR